ncbi:22620_t:CDS:1, partial [Gigaspora rosea]
RLNISNYDKNRINQGIYNRIEGSLEPLKDLKLEHLHISTEKNASYMNDEKILFCSKTFQG